MIFPRTVVLLSVGLLAAVPAKADPNPGIMEKLAGKNKMKFLFEPSADVTGVELRATGAGSNGVSTLSSFSAGEEITFNPLLFLGGGSNVLVKYQLVELLENAAAATSNGDNGRSPGTTTTGAPYGRTITGVFSIVDNEIVDPNIVEEAGSLRSLSEQHSSRSSQLRSSHQGSRRLDIVHQENVIITAGGGDPSDSGSACIGIDCVNGEIFNFDTLRLKENNLRIGFRDTSTSASFPSNDWQITANDSSNGGQNKFSIDDVTGNRTLFTIEAGAPSNSLYVDDGGKVGFGTSTPAVDLHSTSGDTPTLRLDQDASSGFAPQTWDIAGNEANFFVRDVTNTDTNGTSLLPFKIYPGAPTNSLTIDSSGSIGVGTQDPSIMASLVLADTDKGFLINQLTTLERNALGISLSSTGSSISGMMVFDTDIEAIFVWVDSSQAWKKIQGDGEAQDLAFDGTNLAITNGLGVDLSSLEAVGGSFDVGGSLGVGDKIGIGTDAPTEKLHIVGDTAKILLSDTTTGESCILDCSLLNPGNSGGGGGGTGGGGPGGPNNRGLSDSGPRGITEPLSGNTVFTVTFDDELPDENYIVMLTPLSSTNPSVTATLKSKSVASFAFTVMGGNADGVQWLTLKL